MYHINHRPEENHLEITHSSGGVFAQIDLLAGGSLQALTLNHTPLIVDLAPLAYADTYASAVLFPFANRVKDGAYAFGNSHFQLKRNQEAEQNALHGLVYNKTFELVEQTQTQDEVSVRLVYTETELSTGFPFTYKIALVYTITTTSLSLGVFVENTSNKTFPFTIGWHPYFLSSDLETSFLNFSSDKKLIPGPRNIPTGMETIATTERFDIGNQQLDDCWKLNSKTIDFTTPRYKLQLETSDPDSFLQLYTPPKDNTIAIEPTTGVSNSFNNAIGLKTLNPKELYSIIWDLKLFKL